MDDATVDAGYRILRDATKESPITSEEFGRRLGLDDPEGNPEARRVITEVIRTRKLPIASGRSGYFVIASAAELKEYRDDLNRRIGGIYGRIKLVEDAFEATYGSTVPSDDAEDEGE